MDIEEMEWIKFALADNEKKKCIFKILSMNNQGGPAAGDNYISDISRMSYKVLLNSGDVEERSVIFKGMPKSENKRKLFKKDRLFENEAKIFINDIPKIESLRRQINSESEPLFPLFFGVMRKYEGILLEDLCAKGFKTANRTTGLDFNHAELAVQSLAEFHALAAVLKERGDLEFQSTRPPSLSNENCIDSYYKSSTKELATIIEEKWKGKWLPYADKLRMVGESLAPKIIDLFNCKDYKFYTLNHGDCWTTNLMFKYDNAGQPKTLRFIDLQTAFYNSPVFDLHYFFGTSLNLETRSRKSELLHIYTRSLEDFLAIYEYPGQIPTHEDILSDYSAAKYFGLCCGLFNVAIAMRPPEYALDVEKLSKEVNETNSFSISLYFVEDKNFVDIIKSTLMEASTMILV